MAELLRKPSQDQVNDKVKLLQEVSEANADLKYVSFKAFELEPAGSIQETLNGLECCIVALTGKITVSDGENTFEKIGQRETVFEKIPTDSVYISHGHNVEIKADTKARVALCYAPSQKQLPTRLIKAEEIEIEKRGKFNNQRLVHNILPDSDSTADSVLVVEVFTEAGNWSSYPPHKHDQDNLPDESLLEETYYHEIDPPQGFVFQRVYTEDRDIDETMAVENKNVVIVPAGYHPVGVPDGYTSYYLNVMAGPKRVWKFHNEKAHEWIINRQS